MQILPFVHVMSEQLSIAIFLSCAKNEELLTWTTQPFGIFNSFRTFITTMFVV